MKEYLHMLSVAYSSGEQSVKHILEACEGAAREGLFECTVKIHRSRKPYILTALRDLKLSYQVKAEDCGDQLNYLTIKWN